MRFSLPFLREMQGDCQEMTNDKSTSSESGVFSSAAQIHSNYDRFLEWKLLGMDVPLPDYYVEFLCHYVYTDITSV
jgi:hypothetical protein